jgi:predicted DNA-binding protein (UPF0251 family)
MASDDWTNPGSIEGAHHDPGTHRGEVFRSKHEMADLGANAAEGFGIQGLVEPYGRTRLERAISGRVHKVAWVFEFAEGYFTPAELQALALVYGAGMPYAQAARRLGIARSQFRSRVKRAERRVDELYGLERLPRNRWKKGRPNARIGAPDGAVWIAAKVAKNLPMAEGHVWGSDRRVELPVDSSDPEWRLNYVEPLTLRQRLLERVHERLA